MRVIYKWRACVISFHKFLGHPRIIYRWHVHEMRVYTRGLSGAQFPNNICNLSRGLTWVCSDCQVDTVILLPHGVENAGAGLAASICWQRVLPSQYHIVLTLFAPSGQRQTVWGAIKTVCLVWPASGGSSPAATVILCLCLLHLFYPTISCFCCSFHEQDQCCLSLLWSDMIYRTFAVTAYFLSDSGDKSFGLLHTCLFSAFLSDPGKPGVR